jgi:hypothetical protein
MNANETHLQGFLSFFKSRSLRGNLSKTYVKSFLLNGTYVVSITQYQLVDLDVAIDVLGSGWTIEKRYKNKALIENIMALKEETFLWVILAGSQVLSDCKAYFKKP